MAKGSGGCAVSCSAGIAGGDQSFFVKTHRGDWASPPVAADHRTRSQPGIAATWSRTTTPQWLLFWPRPAAGSRR